MLHRRTDLQYDIEQVKWEYNSLLYSSWPVWYESEGGGTQMCLQSYVDDSHPFTNGCGSMKRFPSRTEKGYSILNSVFKNTIFQKITEGHYRSRFMTMVMHSTYSVHQDTAPRLHLAIHTCLLYTSPSPRDLSTSRMPSSA